MAGMEQFYVGVETYPVHMVGVQQFYVQVVGVDQFPVEVVGVEQFPVEVVGETFPAEMLCLVEPEPEVMVQFW